MKRYILLIAGIAGAVYVFRSMTKTPPPAPPPAPPPPLAIKMPEPQPILNPEEMKKITDATRDADQSVRWEAAKFLIKLNHPDADKVIFRMLAQDQEVRIRVQVVELLQDRKGPEISKALTAALNDTEAEVRGAALRALARVGDASAASAVTDLLKDMDQNVRLEAVKTLRILQEKSDEEVRRKQLEIQEQMRKQAEEEARRRAEQQKK